MKHTRNYKAPPGSGGHPYIYPGSVVKEALVMTEMKSKDLDFDPWRFHRGESIQVPRRVR